jgi:hypothetical protein
MADLGGFRATEIHRVFGMEGLDPLPSVSTIKRWLYDEEEARRSIEYKRAAMARTRAEAQGGRLIRANSLTPEFREVRLRALVKTCGLSVEDAATVMTFDAPDHPVSPEGLLDVLGLAVCATCDGPFEFPAGRGGATRRHCLDCRPSRAAAS